MLQRVTGYATNIFGPSNNIISEIKDLQRNYSKRQQGFNRWYRLLSMEDELKQENMESFVGNDPRTTWNMAVFLLQPKPLIIKIHNNNGAVLPVEARATVELIQSYFKSLWITINKANQKRGRETWFWNFVGLLVSTGWYAVPYLMDQEGKVHIDYWNPAHVYPEWSDDPEKGLSRLARLRALSVNQALTNIAANNDWDLHGGKLSGRPIEGHLWKLVPEGVVHGVTMDNRIIKPLTLIEGLDKIPILAGAVAGIPKFDDSTGDTSDTIGQSILATAEPLFRAFNKLQSFNMQLIRDTANPRVLERSTGQQGIIKDAEQWYRRGAIFKGGPQDSIDVIQMPGIPVELQQVLFSIRNQIQKGSFSDLTFGNIIGEVSAALVTQAAEAALQLITPFQDAVIFITSESTNQWYQTYLDNPGIRPDTWPEIPPEILEILKATHIETTYAIKIPGDLASRVSLAKQLNPRLELPLDLTMDMLLPEVLNVQEALAKIEAERAQAHPMYSTVQLIQAMEQAANEARAVDNIEQATLFDSAAQLLKQQITGEATTQEKLGNTPTGEDAVNIIPSSVASRLGGPNGASSI